MHVTCTPHAGDTTPTQLNVVGMMMMMMMMMMMTMMQIDGNGLE
jgi:hypothetical protein